MLNKPVPDSHRRFWRNFGMYDLKQVFTFFIKRLLLYQMGHVFFKVRSIGEIIYYLIFYSFQLFLKILNHRLIFRGKSEQAFVFILGGEFMSDFSAELRLLRVYFSKHC